MLRSITLVLPFALSLCAPAYAQGQNCAPRNDVIERLYSKYGESRQSFGLAPKDRVVETWANENTGTWTITVTMPNGITCLVASGQSYENINEPVTPSGENL